MICLFHDLHIVCQKIRLSYAIFKLLIFFNDIYGVGGWDLRVAPLLDHVRGACKPNKCLGPGNLIEPRRGGELDEGSK